MLNINFFTRSLLVSSFLVSLSPAHAMFGDRESIDETSGRASLTAPTLQKGYELGLKGEYLVSDDGKKYLVTENKNSYNPSYRYPYFFSILGEDYLFSGNAITNNEFCFTYSEGGGRGIRLNPVTQQMEEDPNMPWMPGIELFNLLVKRITEEPIVDKPVTISLSQQKDVSVSLNTVSQEILEPKINTTASQSLSQEVTEEKVSNKKFKIFKEPNVIENKAEKFFYTAKDPQKDLYYGIELLTSENFPWWYQRIGCEAHMLCGREIDFERMMEMQTTPEQRAEAAESNRAFSKALNGSRRETSVPAEFTVPKETFDSMHFGPFEIDQQYNDIYWNQMLAPSGDLDHLGAWRGFKYNLDHYIEYPTWVGYVCSTPLEGPLYNHMPVTSPDLKMAMTLQMSKSFYFPSGIYSSPIAKAFALHNGDTPAKQLSMAFHAAMALFVKEINPTTEYMLVRALEGMKKIFKLSGLKFSESSFSPQAIDVPYLRIGSEDKDIFGDGHFALIDPRTNKVYQIGNQHSFSRNPFQGGVDFEHLCKFPITTMDIEALGK